MTSLVHHPTPPPQTKSQYAHLEDTSWREDVHFSKHVAGFNTTIQFVDKLGRSFLGNLSNLTKL